MKSSIMPFQEVYHDFSPIVKNIFYSLSFYNTIIDFTLQLFALRCTTQLQLKLIMCEARLMCECQCACMCHQRIHEC